MKILITLLLFITAPGSFAQIDPGSSLTMASRKTGENAEKVTKAQQAALRFIAHLHQREVLCGKKTGILSSGSDLQQIQIKLMIYEASHSNSIKCGKQESILSCIADQKYSELLKKMKSEPGLMHYLIVVHQMKKKDAQEMVSYFEKLESEN